MLARDQLTGRTLGDFVVCDKLGEGGFGAVYRAEQPLLQREAVVKVMHRNFEHSELLVQRFLREARLASQLDHPYAAHVYAFGAEEDGLLWIAMELVRGTPLDKMLRTQTTLPIERLVPLMDRICEVVHTAHEQGIVHRDIKPANVIVISRAGRILPKLLDFGIAKLTAGPEAQRLSERTVVPQVPLDASITHDTINSTGETLRTPPDGTPIEGNTPVSGLTQRGSLVGSPRYMAPEQWVDAAAADARADIYALGVLAYEALTGKVPFDGRTLFEVAAAHAEGDVPPVGEKFPAALDAVFKRALAKTPGERYASALDFANAFREASGLAEPSREPLPQLEDSLREALINDAPQPIAEAVAALGAATNAHQARDAIRVVVHVSVRMVGLVALACRTRIGTAGSQDTQAVVDALQALRRRALTDEEWLDLARELCRPFASNADAFPIPELVTMFFSDRTARAQTVIDSLAIPAQADRAGMSEDQVRELVTQSLPGLTRLLRSITFLADYPLVVWRADRAELWMGMRRPKRGALAIRGTHLEPGQPALVDREGRPVLSMWPLVQASEPSPGAPEELFLFEGKGRHGARLVAMPLDFERQDDGLWRWFGESLIDTLDEPGVGDSDAPYRGLAAFTPSDAALFFGREREVESVINRLRVQSLLAVVGPSGAGKSSFVQAGVVPALPADWRAFVVRPGPSPMATLEARLAADGFEIDLRSPSTTLGDYLRSYAKYKSTTIVLVIDQFEELFTLCQDAAERVRYAEALATAARSAEDRVRVILTLRDDFLVAAEQLAPLRNRLGPGLQLLSTPARQDLLRILIEPARRAGYDFEDRELAAQMVDAVADHPGALALLSFAASKLWDLRDRHFKQLGRRAYESMGGVGGALAQYAEQTLSALSADEQRLVREAFRHLVTAEGTRAVLTRKELVQVLGGGERANTVIERLVSARLLVASEGERGEERIEVIHEELLRAWPRLVGWRREDAEGARLRDQLRAAARQWEERGRARGLLWRGEALTEYQLWRSRHPGALTDVETAFANASVGDARRSRRLRTLLLGLAFVSLSVGLAVLYRTNQETKEQRELARANERTAHNRLVDLYEEQGRLAMLANDPMRALVFFELAYREGADDAALQFQISWATQLMSGQIAWLRESGPVNVTKISPDGKIAITGLRDGTIGIWDVASRKQLRRLTEHKKVVSALQLAEDGRSLVSMGNDGVKQWDLVSGSLVRSFDHAEPRAIASNATTVVTGAVDGTVKVWDATTGAMRYELRKHAALVRSVALGSRGELLATSDETGKLYLWRAADGQPIHSFTAHKGRVFRVAFSADDKLIGTTGFDDGLARVWESESGKLVAEVKHGAPRVRGVVFSTDGKRILTWAEDRTMRVTSVESGAELLLMESDAHPLSAQFDRAGQHILATYRDGAARLWDAESGTLIWKYLGHGEAVWEASYDRSGQRFITGSTDGSFAVWDANYRGHVLLRGHVGDVYSSSFSRNDELVSTTDADGKTRIWKRSGELVQTIAMPREYGTAAFSADSREIAVVGEEGGVFDIATGRRRFAFGNEHKLTAVGFNRAGTLIVTSTGKGNLALWDAATGKLVRQWAGHGDSVWYVAFSPDDSLLATAGNDGAKVWDMKTGDLRASLDHQRKYVACVQFMADGQRLLTSADDGLVRMWNLRGADVIAQFSGHQAIVSTVETSVDERVLITSSHDGSVRAWDIATTRPLAQIGALTTQYYSAHYNSRSDAAVLTHAKGASIWSLPKHTWSKSDLQLFVSCRVPARLHARGTSYVPCDVSKLR